MAMEAAAISLFSPFFFFITSLFLAFFISVLLIIKRSSRSRVLLAPLPPGPPRLPLIGNIHQLFGASNPHRILLQLARTHGPLIYLRLGQVDQIVASSVEAVEEIIKGHDLKFTDRPTDLTFSNIFLYGGNGVSVAPYGGYWKQMRKIYAMELLNTRRVKSFAAIREVAARKVTAEIARKALAQTPVNLSETAMTMTNALVIRAAFGDKCKQQAEFLSLIKEALSYVSSFAVADMYPSFKFVDTLTGLKSNLERVRAKIDKVFDEIIAQRQVAMASEQAEEDLIIDVLLKLKDEGNLEFPITSNCVKAILMEIFVAGTETSSTVIGWAMSELIKNPKAMEKVQKEMREAMQGKIQLEESDIPKFSYLNLVIKETLRLHSPTPLLMPRLCTETCEVMGYRVPAGARVIFNAFALSRDEKYWGSDALSFKPERFEGSSVEFKGFNFELMPFGAGRRICPGLTFGVSSIEAALAHFLFHFDWKLPQGMKIEDLDMMEESGITAPRRSPLFVLAKPIIPLP